MAEPYQPDMPRNRGEREPHMSPLTPAEDARTIMINQVSWGAVLAGVVVALVTQLILNMIGIGIGASTLDPGAGASEPLGRRLLNRSRHLVDNGRRYRRACGRLRIRPSPENQGIRRLVGMG